MKKILKQICTGVLTLATVLTALPVSQVFASDNQYYTDAPDNAEVEIINPVSDTVATATYMGADVDWFIKSDDISLKNGKQPAQPNNQQTQNKK